MNWGKKIRGGKLGRAFATCLGVAVVGLFATNVAAQSIYWVNESGAEVYRLDLQNNPYNESVAVGDCSKTGVSDAAFDEQRGRVYWLNSGSQAWVPVHGDQSSATCRPVPLPDAGKPTPAGDAWFITTTSIPKFKLLFTSPEMGGAANTSEVWSVAACDSIGSCAAGEEAPRKQTDFINQYLTGPAGKAALVQAAGVAADMVEKIAFVSERKPGQDRIIWVAKKRSPNGGIPVRADEIEGLVNPGAKIRGLCVDENNSYLYWIDRDASKLYRVKYNVVIEPAVGNDNVQKVEVVGAVEDVYTGMMPWDCAVDQESGNVYVADRDAKKIVCIDKNKVVLGDIPTKDEYGNDKKPFGIGLGHTQSRPLGEMCNFGRPGSVVIWPYVDRDTLLTLTNTNQSHIYCGLGQPDLFQGGVKVKFIFQSANCDETDNKIRDLSPADTLTIRADALFDDIPDEGGWVVAIATSVHPEGGRLRMINFNYLIGAARVQDVQGADPNGYWNYEAYTFRAFNEEGDQDPCSHYLADINADDVLDFNGREFDAFPLAVQFSRVVQEDSQRDSNTDPGTKTRSNFFGVMATTPTVDTPDLDVFVKAQVYNNDEIAFSSDFEMDCHAIGDLDDMNGNTLNMPPQSEDFANPQTAYEDLNSGWMYWYTGVNAGGTQPRDPRAYEPAILAVSSISTANGVAGTNQWKNPPIFTRGNTTRYDVTTFLSEE